MTNLTSMLRRGAASLTIALLAVATVDGSVARLNTTSQRSAALAVFEQRVAAYAALHRDLAASLPASGSRHSAAMARMYLASAIKTARATARQGDIFTIEATRFLRAVIRETTSAADFGMFAPLMDEEGRLLPGLHPGINGPLPFLESREVPGSTLLMLPTLPPELEYRLVDYDLVLWDVTADLIIDVLPYAVAHPASDAIYR